MFPRKNRDVCSCSSAQAYEKRSAKCSQRKSSLPSSFCPTPRAFSPHSDSTFESSSPPQTIGCPSAALLIRNACRPTIAVISEVGRLENFTLTPALTTLPLQLGAPSNTILCLLRPRRAASDFRRSRPGVLRLGTVLCRSLSRPSRASTSAQRAAPGGADGGAAARELLLPVRDVCGRFVADDAANAAGSASRIGKARDGLPLLPCCRRPDRELCILVPPTEGRID